ncbi:Glycosyl hydrolases family 25 [Caprobacter fermentans]|uniref:Glycosyl hydrolases family 25 n=1 Tax=Caproicibacter fermentans TaxID=2576756 RepID=A0A6N8I0R8_9FIRM|nr:GH25 family lysozyme [Caproicibacter fermentans]MVB11686.1 Glycosyl hydrolases family 25 [Caproicibacter fermentans]
MNEKWIDVSAHNGEIGWKQVAASGVRGAVLRAGYGNSPSQMDTRFQNNIAGTAAAGLKTAVYWFSYADSEADALAEWAACKKTIEPYRGKILFVAYDYEYSSVNYYKKVHGTAPSGKLINSMVNTFLAAAQQDGWNAVLYLNNDYRLNVFTPQTLGLWSLWLADYSGGPDADCALQQTTSFGTVPGISGRVDLDAVFRDFSAAATSVEIDTTMDLSRPHGEFYTVKTVCPRQVSLTAGTGGIVTVVPFPRNGNEQLFALVAVGGPGTETGIYTAAPGEKPLKRFVYRVT